MTLCMPDPVEDELAAGVAGRLARMNGLPSAKSAIDLLHAGSRQPGAGVPSLWRLAELLGKGRAEFSSRHSMLPALFPVSRYLGSAKESASTRSVSCMWGMNTPHKNLRWCPACLRRDIQTRGFGIWRRQHQLAGVDTCSDHEIALEKAKNLDAYWPPSQGSDLGSSAGDSERLVRELDAEALVRFQHIMKGWLRRSTPLRVGAWASAVSGRCRAVNIRVGNLGSLPTASDLLRQEMPISWLQRHMPDVAIKRPRTFIERVDGACHAKNVPYPSLICTALLAVLFGSANDALEALDSEDRRLAAAATSNAATTLALMDFTRGSSIAEAGRRHGVSQLSLEAALREKLLRHSS